jgi:hypothetical protein
VRGARRTFLQLARWGWGPSPSRCSPPSSPSSCCRWPRRVPEPAPGPALASPACATETVGLNDEDTCLEDAKPEQEDADYEGVRSTP